MTCEQISLLLQYIERSIAANRWTDQMGPTENTALNQALDLETKLYQTGSDFDDIHGLR